MKMYIEGRYEVVVAVINLEKASFGISQNTDDTEFYNKAKELKSIYSLGDFEQAVNDQELDNLTDSYIRILLVSKDEKVEALTCMSLIVDNPKITSQVFV